MTPAPEYFPAFRKLARLGTRMGEIATTLGIPESRAKIVWRSFRTRSDEQTRERAIFARFAVEAKGRPPKPAEPAPMQELFIGSLHAFRDAPEALQDKGSPARLSKTLTHSPSGSSMGWAG